MTITMAVVAALGVAVLYLAVQTRRDLQAYQAAVDKCVQTLFANHEFRPEAKAGFVYGIPYFTLRFKTDEEKVLAESAGLVRRFVEDIQRLCAHLEPRGEAFDAERAVAVFSEEDELRWKEQAVALRDTRK